jgi:hypothetical protein
MMKYEDLNVDIYLLQVGFRKLLKYGMSTFITFCDEQGIAFSDRNRVIAKAKIAGGKSGLKELPCPSELKEDRWLYYNKIYTRDKAARILKEIDKVAGDMAFDVKRLARGIG